MKKYYSVSEIALITGLSERTIRKYIRNGILKGDKADGKWRFSEDDIEPFLKNEHVKNSTDISFNRIAKDFISLEGKSEPSICSVCDYPLKGAENIGALSKAVQKAVVSGMEGCRFQFAFRYFEKRKSVRIVISGPSSKTIDILNKIERIVKEQ